MVISGFVYKSAVPSHIPQQLQHSATNAWLMSGSLRNKVLPDPTSELRASPAAEGTLWPLKLKCGLCGHNGQALMPMAMPHQLPRPSGWNLWAVVADASVGYLRLNGLRMQNKNLHIAPCSQPSAATNHIGRFPRNRKFLEPINIRLLEKLKPIGFCRSFIETKWPDEF